MPLWSQLIQVWVWPFWIGRLRVERVRSSKGGWCWLLANLCQHLRREARVWCGEREWPLRALNWGHQRCTHFLSFCSSLHSLPESKWPSLLTPKLPSKCKSKAAWTWGGQWGCDGEVGKGIRRECFASSESKCGHRRWGLSADTREAPGQCVRGFWGRNEVDRAPHRQSRARAQSRQWWWAGLSRPFWRAKGGGASLKGFCFRVDTQRRLRWTPLSSGNWHWLRISKLLGKFARCLAVWSDFRGVIGLLSRGCGAQVKL